MISASDEAWHAFRSRLLDEPDLQLLVATLVKWRASPPSAGDAAVRPAFQRMASDELLMLCRDESISVDQRLRRVGRLMGDATAAASTYCEASGCAYPMPYEYEIFTLLAFSVRAGATALALLRDACGGSRFHCNALAEEVQRLLESTCRLLTALVDLCARERVFTPVCRGALLSIILRELPAYLCALTGRQLAKLLDIAKAQGNECADASTWARIAEISGRALGKGSVGAAGMEAPAVPRAEG